MIEFIGDKNAKKERSSLIQESLGAECLIIWENEFKRDPLSTLEKAQKFLLEN